MDDTIENTEETRIVAVDNLSVRDQFLKKWDRDLPDDRRCFGIKLCLAGAEGAKVRDGLFRIGVRAILVSYYYLRVWLKRRTIQEIAEDFGRFDFVFLDSGGFTLMQEIAEGKEHKEDIVTYTEKYYEDLKRIGHIFAGCAEVDIVDKLGVKYSEDTKDELWAEGVPIVPVVHGLGVDHYDKLGWFDKYPYVAIGSVIIERSSEKGYLHQIYKRCKDKGVLIHGFGATSAKTLVKSQFYSCDSTTWRGGSRFGATMVFENGRIRHYDKESKSVRKRYKNRLEENGIIWKDIENDKAFEVDLMNALAWKQLGDYLKYSAIKCYWLTAEEQDRSLTFKTKAFNAEGLIDRGASIARAEARRMSEVSNAEFDDRTHELLHCDSCHMTGRCPRFKEGEVCGYDINIRLESKGDLQTMLRVILEAEYGRVMTGVLFEKLEGGVLDKNLSTEMQRLITMVADIRGIYEPPVETPEEEIHISSKGKSGTLANALASVFAPTGTGKSGSGSTQTQRAAAKVVDVQSEVIDE